MLASALLFPVIGSFCKRQLSAAEAPPRVIKAGQLARGRELFLREWRPFDSRCRDDKPGSTLSGDGLGPVYNDTSCAACHSLGGIGGAGPADKNVQIIVLRKNHGAAKPGQLHPGLRREGSATVLHRSSVSPSYAKWRQSRLDLASMVFEPHLIADMLAAGTPEDSPDRLLIQSVVEKLSRGSKAHSEDAIEVEGVEFSEPPLFLTERNPPALFGANLIDKISDTAIELTANDQQRASPRIAGRVSRTREGRVGRFGWQAQQASVAEFTLTACAVELGLSVPGHPQASEPHRDKQRAPALDMSQDDCDALVTFVAAIAPPREQIFPADAEIVSTGRQLFERVGCADCHLPDLGGVRGIYSDLLLHNMGHQLAGELTVGYGAFVREPTPAEPQRKIAWCGSCWPRAHAPRPVAGFRVSHAAAMGRGVKRAYMHDGRASTLREAILMHAGQGAAAAATFEALDEQQRQFLLKFLSSLVAPHPSDVMPSDEAPGDALTAAPAHRKKPLAASFKPRRH